MRAGTTQTERETQGKGREEVAVVSEHTQTEMERDGGHGYLASVTPGEGIFILRVRCDTVYVTQRE